MTNEGSVGRDDKVLVLVVIFFCFYHCHQHLTVKCEPIFCQKPGSSNKSESFLGMGMTLFLFFGLSLSQQQKTGKTLLHGYQILAFNSSSTTNDPGSQFTTLSTWFHFTDSNPF